MAQPIPMRPTRKRRTSPPPLPKPKSPEQHGRAWINGSEVGGRDARYAHLNRSYD